jgi:hypothetical protein
MNGSKPMLTFEDVRSVAAALEAYTQNRLLGAGGLHTKPSPRRRMETLPKTAPKRLLTADAIPRRATTCV